MAANRRFINKNIVQRISLSIFVVVTIIIYSPSIIAPPPEPHGISGYIFANGTTQVQLGTNYLINDTNSSEYVQGVTSLPIPSMSGYYSVTINGEDGDNMYTLAWNSTHYGKYNYILLSVMSGINVTLNMTRIEQNVTIINPQNNSNYGINITFNVTANITALGGADNQNCSATLNFSNSSVLVLEAGETTQHNISSIPLGNTVNETWIVKGSQTGSSDINIKTICQGQSNFSNDNDANLQNITISVSTPNITTINLYPITLSAGTTTTVWCNGTATDGDGYDNLFNVTGVIYSSSSTSNSAANNNNNYKDFDCSTLSFTTDGKFACSFDVQFFAEPDTWTCEVNVTDITGLSNISTNTSTLSELMAIGIESTTIDFGFLGIGTNSGTSDTIVVVQNMGNVAIDIDLDTYDYNPGSASAMNCTVGEIPSDNIRYNLSSGIDYSLKSSVPALGSLTDNSFSLAKQSGSAATTPSTKNIYWGAGVPGSNIAGNCGGKILFSAIIDV